MISIRMIAVLLVVSLPCILLSALLGVGTSQSPPDARPLLHHLNIAFLVVVLFLLIFLHLGITDDLDRTLPLPAPSALLPRLLWQQQGAARTPSHAGSDEGSLGIPVALAGHGGGSGRAVVGRESGESGPCTTKLGRGVVLSEGTFGRLVLSALLETALCTRERWARLVGYRRR